MPPATASFFKQSRTKMQAWVTNPPGLGHSQPVVAASAPATTYDPSAAAQTQAPTRHVTIPQPRSQSQPQSQPTQQTSPGRSRSPIVNANTQRSATAMSARIPMPSRIAHARDASLNLARSKATSSEPLQHSKRPAPFWDGSTIEGSAFSDTASNSDPTAPSFAHRHLPVHAPPVHAPPVQAPPVQAPPVIAPPTFSYQQHGSPRHRTAPRQSDRPDQPLPFVIGPSGLIDVIENENGNGLARSASTPDARGPRGRVFKEVTSDNGRDPYSDESAYNTSPEKTPSAKRLQHPKLSLRPTRRESSYSERVSYPNGDSTALPEPLRPRAYVQPVRHEPDEMPPVQMDRPTDRLPRLQVPDHQPRRSTIFADTDTPMLSNQDESENASVEREPTPKPVAKTKPLVNRQLFSKPGKDKVTLRESPMPRSPPDNRIPTSKKRPYDLDYDDGALAAMDYEALKGEAFDYDPAQAEARSVFEPPRGTLPEKLEHFLTKDEASQTNFFTKMPVKEWEESGDWFLEKFGDIMEQFKQARKHKREMIDKFESEIAEREEAVRNKIHGIGQTLTELKTEGEGMMLGKELD